MNFAHLALGCVVVAEYDSVLQQASGLTAITAFCCCRPVLCRQPVLPIWHHNLRQLLLQLRYEVAGRAAFGSAAPGLNLCSDCVPAGYPAAVLGAGSRGARCCSSLRRCRTISHHSFSLRRSIYCSDTDAVRPVVWFKSCARARLQALQYMCGGEGMAERVG